MRMHDIYTAVSGERYHIEQMVCDDGNIEMTMPGTTVRAILEGSTTTIWKDAEQLVEKHNQEIQIREVYEMMIAALIGKDPDINVRHVIKWKVFGRWVYFAGYSKDKAMIKTVENAKQAKQYHTLFSTNRVMKNIEKKYGYSVEVEHIERR